MSRDEMTEHGAVPLPAPAQEVPRLLEMYSRALDDAAALPLFIAWVPSRPSRWRLLRPFSKLPRLTLGTHILVVRHIDRNLAMLIRYYSVRQALGHLTKEQARDFASCAAFRNSLPPGKLAATIIGVTVPATMIALLLTPFLLGALDIRGPISETFQQLAKESLNLFTGGGGGDLLTAVGRAINLGAQGFLAILGIALITGYLATRPLVSSFRLKRQILCLAEQDVLDVQDTASSWYVNKSVGAYSQERRVAGVLGLRRPTNERPLDLVTLAFPALCVLLFVALLTWTLRAVAEGAFEESPVSESFSAAILPWFLIYLYACVLVWLASLGVLRFRWLQTSWSGRQSRRLTPPMAYITSSGDYVESRPVTEAAAWPLATGIPLLTWLLYPLLGLFHFYRFVQTGDRLRAEAARRKGRQQRRSHPLLATSAFASVIATPIVVSVHLWRLCALLDQPRALRRYRAFAILACSLLIAPWLMPFFGDPAGDWWIADSLLLSLDTLLYPLLIAAIQRCQNHLAQTLAIPMPYGQCEESRKRPTPEGRPVR